MQRISALKCSTISNRAVLAGYRAYLRRSLFSATRLSPARLIASNTAASSANTGALSSSTDSETLAAKAAAQREQDLAKKVFLSGIKVNGSTRRFFEQVSVEKVDGGFAIKLGQHFVQTPKQKRVVVPTEELAQCLALEWDSQVDRIRPTSMPLMKLVMTALDHVAENRRDLLDSFMRTLRNDAICFRGSDSRLSKLHKKHWTPLLDWMAKDYGCKLIARETVMPIVQPEESMQRFADLLFAQSDWALAAIDSLAAASKSLVLSWAVFMDKINVAQAAEAARLEENFQMRQYGEVDGVYAHQIELEYIRQQVAAVRTLINTLGPHAQFRQPTAATKGRYVYTHAEALKPQSARAAYQQKVEQAIEHELEKALSHEHDGAAESKKKATSKGKQASESKAKGKSKASEEKDKAEKKEVKAQGKGQKSGRAQAVEAVMKAALADELHERAKTGGNMNKQTKVAMLQQLSHSLKAALERSSEDRDPVAANAKRQLQSEAHAMNKAMQAAEGSEATTKSALGGEEHRARLQKLSSIANAQLEKLQTKEAHVVSETTTDGKKN